MLITRRGLLKSFGLTGLGTVGLGSYGFAIEPGFMLGVTPYQLTPPNWPADLHLRIAVIADIHACEPFMSATRVRAICELANSTKPDLVVLLGDYNGGHNMATAAVMPDEIGEAVSVLRAPLGAYAILGNHDWWHGPLPNMRGDEAKGLRNAFKYARVTVMENDALRLSKNGAPFWLLGLADQMVYRIRRGVFRGLDDLDATLSPVKDKAPAILLAHEPFIFNRVPDRVALTLCGHTHGGQVDLPIIGSPIGERRFGNHVYGHIVEENRHMIISSGLGTSIVPVRLGRPPEIVVVDLGHPPRTV
jgi:predicted MPP superfamily phosphohydrolase